MGPSAPNRRFTGRAREATRRFIRAGCYCLSERHLIADGFGFSGINRPLELFRKQTDAPAGHSTANAEQNTHRLATTRQYKTRARAHFARATIGAASPGRQVSPLQGRDAQSALFSRRPTLSGCRGDEGAGGWAILERGARKMALAHRETVFYLHDVHDGERLRQQRVRVQHFGSGPLHATSLSSRRVMRLFTIFAVSLRPG